MHKTRLIALGFAAATTLSATSAGAATAAPVDTPNSLPFQLTCDNGQTYSTVAKKGATPAHVLDGNSVMIPVAFGEITFTTRDQDGNIIDQEVSPPSTKGNSANNPNATTSCSFFGAGTDPDGTTFTIVGTVTGFFTPAR